MIGRSDALAPRLAGVTAQVEATPQGTRVTLRPSGAGRWFTAAFLAVWLTGWAIGEAFAVCFLARLLGVKLGLFSEMKVPPVGLAAVLGGFLLFWLALWTWGGFSALITLARLGWGVDVLTVTADNWTVWSGVSRWGRSRRFNPKEARRVGLQGRTGALVAKNNGRTVVLTRLGTDADRLWLRDLLQDAASGIGNAVPGSLTPGSHQSLKPSPLPPGYRMEPLPDGSLRVRTAASRRIGGAGCLLLVALFWDGIVGGSVLLGCFRRPVEEAPSSAMAPGAWGYWLFLTPFILIGLALITAFIVAALTREEWRVRRDHLEIRREYLGRRQTWRYTGAAFRLTVHRDSDGDESWRLVLEAADKQRRLDSGDPAMLRALGRFLAERTGWPLHETGWSR
jgi:hypothetical protein